MNVPKLRFTDDDGREFPSWHAKKIGDFVISHKGGAPLKPSDFIKEGSFEVIPKKAISSGGHLFLDKTEPTYCTAEFFENNQRSVVDKNYLITTLRDLVPSGPSIGYIVKFNNDKKYILAQGVYGIKISDDLLDDFLIQYSNTDNYRVLMQTMMVGSTQVHIRNSDFFQTHFCVPCLEEQTKIANFLTAVDEKISKLTQKSDLLARYKKGVMQKIFSQELRFKDDDGREFPEWKKLTLNDVIVTINNGLSIDQNAEGIGFKVTRIETISDRKINLNKVGYVDTEVDVSEFKLNVGDILFSNINSLSHIGKVVYVDKDYDLFHGMNLLRVVVDVTSHNPQFIFFQLSTDKLKRNFESKANKAVNQASINQTELKKTELQIPSKKEQTKIANFLSVIDDKITQTQAELDAVKQYKQGLLQQMFI